MVVCETFVWAHIPKTGGDATSTMIGQVPRLVVLADPPGDNAKHLPLDQRRDSVSGKLLVANVRRLPAWAFSLMRHRARFGRWPSYEPEGLQPPDVVAAEPAADRVLNTVVGDYEIDVWLRQEHLLGDLLAFLRTVTTLTDSEEAAIRSVGRVNQQADTRDVRGQTAETFFSPAHIEMLYAANPRWASIEQRIYG